MTQPDFAFYRDKYLGEDIPEEQFQRYAKRAGAKLARFKQMFLVTPRPGVEDAEANALCAVADALYDFAQEDARRGLAVSSVSVGSVSESYAAPEALSPTTLYLRERHCCELASDFLLLQRWVAHA